MKYYRLATTISLLLATQLVSANPNGAQVVQGAAVFSNPSVNVLNVKNSRNAIINWQSFNIGAGQTTNFIQPSSTSAVLNRVISNNPSQILGNLNSNGRVFLINQHGILVGEGANINTTGFFGSTLNITDADYLNGNLKFDGGGKGNFENQGYIHAGADGSIVLIAPDIENGGVIEVENGNIILAAGKSITITSLENSAIQFEVSSAENKITNLGQVIAKNGAASLFAGTLKHSGSIRAGGLVQNADGSISLVATDRVEVSGSVDVSGEQGGTIKILGEVVDISDGAYINASGVSGGGEILLGGDQQGLNPDITNATSTTVALNAEVHADAGGTGDGGKVIVFAKNDVHIHGEITAKGGLNGGDGGFIETSGLQQLDITRVPDASAENGQGGDWLIDPSNIEIIAGNGFTGVNNSTPFVSTAESAQLGVDLITAALNLGASVTVSTGNGGAELGDIIINTSITASPNQGGVSLVLNAHNDIYVNADITGNGLSFDLMLNSDSDSVDGGQINFSDVIIDISSQTVTLDGPSLVTGNLSIPASSGGSWILNHPMTIDAGGAITVTNGGSGASISGSAITNNGSIIMDSGCNLFNDCNEPTISSPLTNNSVFEITSGIVNIDSDFVNSGAIDIQAGINGGLIFGNSGGLSLSLEAGSNFTAIAGSVLLISAGSDLNVNTPVILPSSMVMELNGGKINNVQNLGIPDTFNIAGGIIIGSGDFNIPVSATVTTVGSVNGGLTISGVDANNKLTVFNEGYFSWEDTFSSVGAISLTDALFENASVFNINLTEGPASMTGNGRFINSPGALINVGGTQSATINLDSSLNNEGELDVNFGSTLLLQVGGLTDTLLLGNAAVLAGTGTLNADVVVDNGGLISPNWENFGLLTIDGDLTVNAGANLLFHLEMPVDGQDSLFVTGAIDLNDGNLFVHWQGDVNSNISGGETATFISCNSAIAPCLTTNTPLTLIEPLGSNGSSITIEDGAGTDDIDFNVGTVANIIIWDGSKTGTELAPLNWNTDDNWLGGVVPDDGDLALIDIAAGDIFIDISDAVTVDGVQSEAHLTISDGGSLTLNGDSFTSWHLIINGATAALAGTGTLYAMDNYTTYREGADITIAGFVNNSIFEFIPNNITSDLVFNGTAFTNNGAMLLLNTVDADVYVQTGDIHNNGFLIVDTPVGVNIDLSSNAGAVGIDTGVLTLNRDLNNNGRFDILTDASLSVSAGSALFMQNGSSITGSGTIDINNLDASIDFLAGVMIDSTLTLKLENAHLTGAQNLNVPDTVQIKDSTITALGNFNLPLSTTLTLSGVNTLNGNMEVDGELIWDSGVLQNSGTASLNTTDNAFITLGAAGSTSINGVDWTNDGIIEWVSADDFIINNATYTSLGGGVFGISTTDNNADITGNGTFDILAGSFEIFSSSASDLNIGIPFNLQTNLDIAQVGFNLIFENDTSYDGAINIDAGSFITISSGTHTFAPTLFFDSDLILDGGTLKGELSIDRVMDIKAGIDDVIFDAFTLETTDNTFFSSDGNDLLLNNATVWTNSGTLNINNTSGGADFINDDAGFISMVNGNGALINVSSTTNMDFFTPFDNQGTVNVTDFNGPTIFATNNPTISSGTIDIAAGAQYWVDSGTDSSLTLAGVAPRIIGSGLFVVDTNTVFDVATAVVMDSTLTLQLNTGGEIASAENLTIPDTFNITGGKISGIGAGTFTTAVDSVTVIDEVVIEGLNWVSQGSVDWIPADIALNNFTLSNSVFTNQGTLLLQNSHAGSIVDIIGNSRLINDVNGAINIDPDSDLVINVPITNNANTGSLNLLSGMAVLNGTDNFNQGKVNLAVGTTLSVSAGASLSINADTDFSGSSGILAVDGGILNVVALLDLSPEPMSFSFSGGLIDKAGNLTVPANFKWSSGTISDAQGVNFILPVGTSTFLGGGSISLDSVNLINQGDIIWSGTGGTLAIDNGAVWNNLSQMTFQNTSQVDISSNTPLNSGISNLLDATLLIDTTSIVSITAPFTNHDPNTANSGATIDLMQGTLKLSAALELDETASLFGGGILDTSLVVANASVYPGNDIGELNVTEDVTFNAGSELVIQLDSANSDLLTVTGNASINPGASLSVVAENGYDGVYEESFSVLEFAGLSGSFDNLNQETSFSLSPTYAANQLDLIVSSLINNWTGSAADDLWSTAGNWSRGTPGAGHEIYIIDGVSTVIHDSGDITLAGLTTNAGTQLDVTGGSIIIDGFSDIGGILNLSDSSLSTISDLTISTLSLSNASLTGNGTDLTVINPITVSGVSNIDNWGLLQVPQLSVAGTLTLSNIVDFAHQQQITIVTALDQLTLQDTTMTTGDVAGIDGAGTLELQNGSDWIINADPFPVLMPEAMTLNIYGGKITNVENLTFPGIVNVDQASFVENDSIVIRKETTFNYYDNNPISPLFDVINDGTFNVLSDGNLNLTAQNLAVFINNGTLNIAAESTLSVFTELQNNGDITGGGVLTVNGGVLDILAQTVLPASLGFNLLSGDIQHANNLKIESDFNWVTGTISGDGVNSGFETTGVVSLKSGTLNTDWLISAGSVDWTGFDFDNLVINDATITNQGVFTITTLLNDQGNVNTHTALKDFSSSTNAGFINQGTLLVDAGDEVVIFDLNFDNDGGIIGIISGVFSLDGTDLELDQASESLQGFGEFSGNVINTLGVVTPGMLDLDNANFQTGTLSIAGNFSQGSGGTTIIKLDSTLDGLEHDVLEVDGVLTADGSIDFRVINGASVVQVAALLDQSFAPISFGSFAGKFTESTIPEGLNFTLGEGGVITVTSDLPLLNEVANQIEVLLSQDNLDFTEVVQAMKFIDQKIEVALYSSNEEEEDDEKKRAPRLVCK